MVGKSRARYTTIITPAGTDYETANARALGKAKSLVNECVQITMGSALVQRGLRYRINLARRSGRSRSWSCLRNRISPALRT